MSSPALLLHLEQSSNVPSNLPPFSLGISPISTVIAIVKSDIVPVKEDKVPGQPAKILLSLRILKKKMRNANLGIDLSYRYHTASNQVAEIALRLIRPTDSVVMRNK